MSDLIAIAYPEEATAHEVAGTLKELQRERTIQLDDLVVAVRADDGRMKLRQSWGGLIGLIFLMPLMGMAIGGVAGATTDHGIDDRFMKDLGDRLPAGGAALFVLAHRSTPDKVLPRISRFGGDVVHTSLDAESEQLLEDALRVGAPA